MSYQSNNRDNYSTNTRMHYPPGHGKSLQGWTSSLSPTQSAPSNFGGGFVQLLDRLLVPPPQDTLHRVNAPNGVQFASTGHPFSLHDWNRSLSPSQSAPPNEGAGLVHVRCDFCIPPPHVTGHCSQAFHAVHFPSTACEKVFLLVTLNVTRCD